MSSIDFHNKKQIVMCFEVIYESIILKYKMLFNFENSTFEYVKNKKYFYYNYVNKGIFEYDEIHNIIILLWDHFPREEFHYSQSHNKFFCIGNTLSNCNKFITIWS